MSISSTIIYIYIYFLHFFYIDWDFKFLFRAALHCIGIILKSLGDKILSLVPETVNICLKTIKNSSNVM